MTLVGCIMSSGPDGVASTVPALTTTQSWQEDQVMADDQSTKLCACGCGKPLLSKMSGLGPTRYRYGHRSRTQFKPAEERFWNNVQKTESCWVWTGSVRCKTRKEIYGSLSVNCKNVAAHRFSWELHFGEILGTLQVLHHCDNPLCVNPAHLFLGGTLENMQDKTRKGRQCKGESHGIAKLTEEKVRAIRLLCSRGISRRSLARQFGVSSTTINRIISGERWGHVGPLTC